MKKFEFDKQKVEVKICGKKYTVDADYNTSKKCDDIQKKAKEIFNRLSKDENSVTESELCEFFLESIDKILGDGSAVKIFMGRKVNFVDASQLFNFVIREMVAKTSKSLNMLGGF